MKVAILGTGYVGLVTGTCLAEVGNHVTCIDIDKEKIAKLNNGIVPIYEPKLDELIVKNAKHGRLKFTTSAAEAVECASIVFLALPTPPGEDGSADLSYVLKAAESIGKFIKSYKIIINKSTVPVGTARLVFNRISALAKADFDVVSNPEFLREGFAVDDFMKPDRVVIGTASEQARAIVRKLYAPFTENENKIVFMDERSAELTKYVNNSYLAMRISFMNEVANLCEKLDADVDMVRAGVGSDTRIGNKFLCPGIGYGGSCFPKDVKALIKIGEAGGHNLAILKEVERINEEQKKLLVKKVMEYFNHDLKGKRIAVWGLAFKPNTDDIREAPSLVIIKELLEQGASVAAYDPEAVHNVRKQHKLRIKYGRNRYRILKNADALIIATEWSVFKMPDFNKIAKLMRRKVIFDGRNMYDPAQFENTGFYYESIGRKIHRGTTVSNNLELAKKVG
jgi:UDPglucose 6-dehydrogenase